MKDERLKDIGSRWKLVRGSSSQEEFGALFGLSRNTVIRYESGEREPGVGLITKICEHFGINPAWFLLGEGQQKLSDLRRVSELNADVLEAIIQTLKQQDDKGQPTSRQIAVALALFYNETLSDFQSKEPGASQERHDAAVKERLNEKLKLLTSAAKRAGEG